jgi:Protein kinase domain
MTWFRYRSPFGPWKRRLSFRPHVEKLESRCVAIGGFGSFRQGYVRCTPALSQFEYPGLSDWQPTSTTVTQAATDLHARRLGPVGRWHSHGAHGGFRSAAEDQTVARPLPAVMESDFTRPERAPAAVTAPDTAVLRARFKAEAESVARLHHPHIVQTYAWDQHEGHPYLAVEFVEGGRLKDRIKGQPQPPHDAARLVLLLARAVHAAHQEGIVHRDLKPANVLLACPAGDPALNTAVLRPPDGRERHFTLVGSEVLGLDACAREQWAGTEIRFAPLFVRPRTLQESGRLRPETGTVWPSMRPSPTGSFAGRVVPGTSGDRPTYAPSTWFLLSRPLFILAIVAIVALGVADALRVFDGRLSRLAVLPLAAAALALVLGLRGYGVLGVPHLLGAGWWPRAVRRKLGSRLSLARPGRRSVPATGIRARLAGGWRRPFTAAAAKAATSGRHQRPLGDALAAAGRAVRFRHRVRS